MTCAARPRTILVVEDDAGVRELANLILTQAGYVVVTARDGEDALGLIEHLRPALVLLDINMPRMSGLDVLAWMARQPCRPPVVMMTANGDRDMVRRTMQSGAMGYILKPFEPAALVARVRQVLQQPVRGAAAAGG